MKIGSAILVILLGLSMASVSQAALDYGLELGARQQSGDAAGLDIGTNARTGWQFGGFVHIPMDPQQGPVHWRMGLLYTTRPIQSENQTTGEKINYDFSYLDIPMHLLFKFHEKVGIYMGFNVAINISKDCDYTGCKVSDVDTPTFPGVFGVLFKFNPKMGANFYLEGLNGQVARGLGDFKAVGLNFTYSLD